MGHISDDRKKYNTGNGTRSNAELNIRCKIFKIVEQVELCVEKSAISALRIIVFFSFFIARPDKTALSSIWS